MELVKKPPEGWGKLVEQYDQLIQNMSSQGRIPTPMAERAYEIAEAIPSQTMREKYRYHSLGLLSCNSSRLLMTNEYSTMTINSVSDELAAYVQSKGGSLRVRHIKASNFPKGLNGIAAASYNMLGEAESLLADALLCVSHDQSVRKLPKFSSEVIGERLREQSIEQIKQRGISAKGFRIPIFGAAARLFREWLLLQPEIKNWNPTVTLGNTALRSSSSVLLAPARKVATVRLDELESAPMGSLLSVNGDGTLDAAVDQLPDNPCPVIDPRTSFHDERLSCPALSVRNVLRQPDEPTGAIEQALQMLPEIVIETRRKL